MNYEDTKIVMTKVMQERNYGKDTRKKCFITLNQICKHSEKYYDTNLLDAADARSIFEFLHDTKKINPSTINNYRSALKFIYTAILKKEWAIIHSRVSISMVPLIYLNKRLMYNLIFKASSETVKELSADKKYLGGQIGITAVLHTWGQNLMYHPHIHMIIPGGALTDTNKWQKSKEKFFIPVKVLSKKFRGKFLFYLRHL